MCIRSFQKQEHGKKQSALVPCVWKQLSYRSAQAHSVSWLLGQGTSFKLSNRPQMSQTETKPSGHYSNLRRTVDRSPPTTTVKLTPSPLLLLPLLRAKGIDVARLKVWDRSKRTFGYCSTGIPESFIDMGELTRDVKEDPVTEYPRSDILGVQ